MNRHLSLTSDPISRLTWQIALPMSVGMFFHTMFNVVDTFCAGWLGTEALAALSLSFPVFFILISIGSGLSQATTALIANALGAEDTEDARLIFTQSIFFALSSGLLLSLLGLLCAPWLYQQLGAEGSYLRTSLSYMNVILTSAVFFLVPMVLNAALSSAGNTRPYRNFLIAGFFANLALNPIFIWGLIGIPRMGVGGIALATVLIQIGGASYLWLHVRKSPHSMNITWQELIPKWKVLSRIAAQAIPASLNMLTIAMGIFVITWFVKHFGKEAVAASGISVRIEQIVLMPAIGLNSAVMSLVGQNFGAHKLDRVREAWITNVKYGAGMMVLGGLIIYLVRDPAMRLFTSDEVVISHGKDYLLSASLTLPAYPILFVTVFALQGIKKPSYGLWIGLYRQLIAPVIVFHTLTFSLGWQLWGVWWGICLVTWSAALFAIWLGFKKFPAVS